MIVMLVMLEGENDDNTEEEDDNDDPQSKKMMLGPPALVSLATDPAQGGISASLTSSLTDQRTAVLPLRVQISIAS